MDRRNASLVRALIPAGFLVLVSASMPAGSTGHDVAKLAWLAGCWQGERAEPGSGEHWMPLAGGTMLGMSRTVQHGRTVEFEFMQVRHLRDGTLAFIAQPSGQRTTIFPALRITETEAAFENPQHDFPQRVIYVREEHSRLRARIEGLRAGKPTVVEFPMNRVACDGQAQGSIK